MLIHFFKVQGAYLAATVETLKGALSGLRQFLTTESPLKIILKSAFYFALKIFVPKMF